MAVISAIKNWTRYDGDKGNAADMEFTAKEDDNTAFNLTGYTVTIIISSEANGELIAQECTVTSATDGEFRYRPTAGELALTTSTVQEDYEVQIRIDKSGEQIIIGAGTFTLKPVFDFTEPVSPTPVDPVDGEVQTTDDTWTSLNTLDLDDEKAYTVTVRWSCKEVDTLSSGGGVAVGIFYRTGGGFITQIGSTYNLPYYVNDDFNIRFDFDTGSGDRTELRFEVQGIDFIPIVTVDWAGDLEYTVAPAS